jgi:hypothetical protein
MRTAIDVQVLMNIERRLTAIEYRLAALERRKTKFDASAFLKGLWGKGFIILLLLAAQVPMKDALLTVLR